MSTRNDGGPAFPIQDHATSTPTRSRSSKAEVQAAQDRQLNLIDSFPST